MPKDTIPQKEQATNQGFSIYPEQQEMLADLMDHYQASRSRVLQYLIEKEYKTITEGKDNA